MIVIQLVTCRQRRGAEVFAAELCRGLAARGHQACLAGLNRPPSDPLTPEGAQTADVGTTKAKAKLRPQLVYRLGRYLKTKSPDVMQANGAYALKYAVLARWLFRGRWALVYRNIGLASDWLRYPGHRFWMQCLVRAADHTVSVSDESQADLQRTFGLNQEQTSVAHRGVPTTPVYDAQGAREHLVSIGLPSPDHEVLLHVGGFTPEKNHAWLVKSFATLQATVPQAHLFFAGDGPEREAVEQQVARTGLSKRIHFLGIRSNVSRLMAGADLLLLPSLTEGLPGVVMEAGIQGTPVVANDVGGTKAAIRNGETGVLVPEGDRDAFTGAIAGLLKDKARRREMGNAAQRHIREHFSIDRSVANFEHLFERITAHPDE